MGRTFEVNLKNKVSCFKVAIDSIEVAEFQQVRGLDIRIDVLEYREGGINERAHKLVGGTKHANIILTRGTSDSTELWDWIKKTMDGTIERKNGEIMALDQSGSPVLRWVFMEGWPSAYKGPKFRAGESEIAIEALTISHKGFELKKGDVGYEKRIHAGGGTPMFQGGGGSGAVKKKDWPPRNDVAAALSKKACLAADKAWGKCGRKTGGSRVIAVFTEEKDGKIICSVGGSARKDADMAALQEELNKPEYGSHNGTPVEYRVADEPIDHDHHEAAPGAAPPGNCAEPHAANPSENATGFDTRARDKKTGEKYAIEDGDGDSDHPQVKPCDTCETNKDDIVGQAGG